MSTVQKIKLTLLAATTVVLRLVYLGWSDYQGDEIKAFLLPEPGQDPSAFLLSQRKGPIQFVVTYLLHLVLGSYYDHRFAYRLLFALAGCLSVFFFYKVVAKLLDAKTAFYAALFFSFNGFLVAFSRIVQYQAFVILFELVALWLFGWARDTKKYGSWGIVLGFLFWALALLAHYDGLFIFPVVLYLIWSWYNQEQRYSPILCGGLVFGLLLASFYLPFLQQIDSETKSYWLGRFGGTGGKLSSSTYLFTVYQPIYVVHIYKLLALVGFVFILVRKKFLILAWFLVPFIFMEGIVSIPGTHIYTYLIPAFAILGYGLSQLESILLSKVANLRLPITKLFYLGLVGMFTFIFLQAYAVFVDHTYEYPYEYEPFLLWTLPKPTPVYHLSMFGFPYFRNWDAIRNYVVTGPLPDSYCNRFLPTCKITESTKNMYYSTNERKSISRFHIPYPKDSNQAGYFVHINQPQSFTDGFNSEKAQYWAKTNQPVFVSFICRASFFDKLVGSLTNTTFGPSMPNDSRAVLGNTIVTNTAVCHRPWFLGASVYYMPSGPLEHIKDPASQPEVVLDDD